MTLTDHLEELRSRIWWSLASWAAASCLAYTQVGRLFDLTRPLLGKARLVFTGPTDAFFAYLKLAMVAGLFLASPVILYHALMFIVPGLEKTERKWLLRLMPVAIFLFLAGSLFAYVVVLPVTMKFFLSFSSDSLDAMIKIDDFMGFVVGLLAICGVIFQLPLILMVGALVGLVRSSFLAKQRRICYFMAFVISAIATPTPDAFTCSVVAVPMIILFEISLVMIRLMGK